MEDTKIIETKVNEKLKFRKILKYFNLKISAEKKNTPFTLEEIK